MRGSVSFGRRRRRRCHFFCNNTLGKNIDAENPRKLAKIAAIEHYFKLYTNTNLNIALRNSIKMVNISSIDIILIFFIKKASHPRP